MLILGIETSGLAGSIALVRDGHALECLPLEQAGRRHAQSLVLEIRNMLSRHQFVPRQIEAIAVSRGPGSFTGLRVGLVCAKTLAYAVGCRFVAVDTFAAIARNCPHPIRETWIVEDAQRGDLFAGRYLRLDSGEWRQTNPIEIVNADQWLPLRGAGEFVVGRGLVRCDISRTAATCLIHEPFAQPSALAVALLGEQLLTGPCTGLDFDFWKAVPFYLRPSAAEEKRDQLDSSRS